MGTESSSSNGFLYFIVGALLVGMVVLGVMYFSGSFGGPPASSPVERAAESVGDAADKVGDAVQKSGD